MALRPFWKGYMKLSLVTCPVAMTPATSEEDKVRFHVDRDRWRAIESSASRRMPNRPAGRRGRRGQGLRRGEHDMSCSRTRNWKSMALESARTIDIEISFAAESIDWIWYDTPYYVTPDDPVGEEAYCVIRDAMRSTGDGRRIPARAEPPRTGGAA